MKNKNARKLVKNALASISFLNEKIYYSIKEVEESTRRESKNLSNKKVIKFAMICPFTGSTNKYLIVR